MSEQKPEIIPPVDEDEEKKDSEEETDDSSEIIEEPAKVIRIGAMIRKLLEEVREAQLDEQSRIRMREIYETSVKELSEGLSPDLRDELDRLATQFDDDGGSPPSEAELRIAQAQLVGWLEGLFHGIQATLVAQQVAAQTQLSQMHGRGLPVGRPTDDPSGNTGYL